MKKVLIYTDGACSGNPGPGGYGAILIFGEIRKEVSGYSVHTTNNRMELTAALEALRLLREPCEVELASDSAYLVNAFNSDWISQWKKSGWKKSSKSEVKNKDLWQELDIFNSFHKISWIKVKGHSDNEYNNLCDKLATEEIKKRKQTIIEKLLKTEDVYTGNIIKVQLLTVSLPDGRETTRDVIRHPGASVVIPMNENNEIYMVRQYRTPISAMTLELPAGKLDKGEEPLICATRELREETGLTAEKLEKLFAIHTTPGFCDEVLHIYLATSLHEGESSADEDEFLHSEKFDLNDLIKMIFQGEITDAKSIIGIFAAARLKENRD